MTEVVFWIWRGLGNAGQGPIPPIVLSLAFVDLLGNDDEKRCFVLSFELLRF